MTGAGAPARRRWLWMGAGALLLMLAVLAYDAWRIEAVFESEPPGAVVRIDGRGLGVTPLTVTLSPGRHQVTLTHSHFEPEVLPLDVSRGDRVQRTVTFRRGVGRLSLLSNPRGAWVELDGRRLEGVTPLQTDAPTGPVTVRMGLAERRPQEKDVIVLADQILEVNLSLDMDPHGSLTVVTSPADAMVRFPELEVGYRPGVRLPIGEQLIEVSRNGFETQQIRFDVRYGDNHTRVALTRALGAIRVRTNRRDAEIRLAYEGADGRRTTVPYEDGMRLPVGPVEVTARALGYRTAFRTADVVREGVSVDLTLAPMNVRVGETFRDPLVDGGEGPLMIVVPPGRFVMGTPGGVPSVTPATERLLAQPFAMSVNEVSVAEYARYATAAGARLDDRLIAADEPVRYVSWAESVAYADWLSRQTGQRYRLPTEAEWEYVARAGSVTDYFFGDDPARLCEFANIADQSSKRIFREWSVTACDDGFGRLAPVGSFPPNPFGLHDLLGNVAEWVLECGVPPYDGAPEDGSEVNRGQSCDTHGIRGGAWDSQAEAVRSARRAFSRDRGDDRGIRLVKEL
ncbi:MAG: SUMF1/EgtB/PvdO family nonheme iron enzyme [Pseudomonadales bacterium]